MASWSLLRVVAHLHTGQRPKGVPLTLALLPHSPTPAAASSGRPYTSSPGTPVMADLWLSLLAEASLNLSQSSRGAPTLALTASMASP